MEIGVDRDHVHFLVQSVPIHSPIQIVRIIKSVTAREIFHRIPEIKNYCVEVSFGASIVGRLGDESKIANYVRNQGREKN